MIDVHAVQRRQLRRAYERVLLPLLILLLTLGFTFFNSDRKAEADRCQGSGTLSWAWIASYAICNFVMFISKVLVYKFWQYGYEAAAQGVMVRSLEACYLIFALLRFVVFIFASVVIFRASTSCRNTRFFQTNIYLYIMLWFETICPVYCVCLALIIFAFGILPMARLFHAIQRGINASDIASDPSQMTTEEVAALESDVQGIPTWKYRYVPDTGQERPSLTDAVPLPVSSPDESSAPEDSSASATSTSPIAVDNRAAPSGHATDDDEPMCAICMMPYEEGDVIKKLPCGGDQSNGTRSTSPSPPGERYCDRFSLLRSHHFHQECVDPWLKKKVTCPICRVQIPLPRFGEFVTARATELNNSRLRQMLITRSVGSAGDTATSPTGSPTATRLHMEEENTASVRGINGEPSRSSDAVRIHLRTSSGSPREAHNRHTRTNPLSTVHTDTDRSSTDRVVVEILDHPNAVRDNDP